MTASQELLWSKLSTDVGVARFRRQYVIGTHSVDFYCRKFRIIIEISGRERRKDRDVYLAACGYTLFRFTEDEINNGCDRAVAKIRHCIRVIVLKEKLDHALKTIIHFAKSGTFVFGTKKIFPSNADIRLQYISVG